MSITLSAYGTLLLNLVVGTILPLVVAFVTKRVAHPGVKAVVLLALNAIYALLIGWYAVAQTGAAFDLGVAAMTALLTFGTGVLAHLGFLKPIQVTGSEGVIQSNVPGGVG